MLYTTMKVTKETHNLLREFNLQNVGRGLDTSQSRVSDGLVEFPISTNVRERLEALRGPDESDDALLRRILLQQGVMKQ